MCKKLSKGLWATIAVLFVYTTLCNAEDLKLVEIPAQTTTAKIKPVKQPAPTVTEDLKLVELPAPAMTEDVKPIEQPAPAMTEDLKLVEIPAQTMTEEIKPVEQPAPAMTEDLKPIEQPAPTMTEDAKPVEQPAPTMTKDLKPIKLPAPTMTGGRPLMEVLKERRTSRSFAKTKLSEWTLSNLLWAAWGINLPEHNLRTAPSASNQQEIDVYVVLEKGVYIYDAKSNELTPVLAGDFRGATGTQRFVKNVPLNLVYVADHKRMYAGGNTDKRIKEFYSAANAGHISQNVYLYCASEGLGTVVRGLIDREALARTLKLRPGQNVILAQSVGYPKGSKRR